ncbi:MAG: magnesium transporter [Clostridia bacterium]|nr:magnesium transporter [Clostridia bacterium]
MNKQVFKNYHSRLVWEGVFKSAIYGLIVGLMTSFAISLVSWIFGYNGIWLSIGLGLSVALISAVAVYFMKLRPTAKDIARRVDQLGLDERIITMMELENDDSYIAMRQREDAHEKLATVSHKQLKFKVSQRVVAMICSFAVLAPAMTVVANLAAKGILKSFVEIVNPPVTKYIEITYEADDGGVINGEEVQVIIAGEKLSPVVAEAEDGWVFVEWSDGNGDPYRSDSKITEDTVFIAIFEEVGEDPDPGAEGEGNGSGQGMPSDMPGEGQGQGQGQGEGQGKGEGQGEGNGKGQGEGQGGKYLPKNQILNGQEYYLPHLEGYLDSAMESLSQEGDIPGDLLDAIQSYYESLK